MTLKFVSIFACVLLAACSSDECRLEGEAIARAGKGAVDCGHVPVGGDRTATDDCVVRAFEGGMAFHARYEQRGEDSHVALGLARSASGTLTILQYDGDPGGGGGDGDAVVSATVCEAPQLAAALSSRGEGTSPFVCTGTRSLGRICE